MSLKRQTLYIMSPLLVVSVVNIFSVPLFVRYLSEDMFALNAYVIAFTGMFGFADLGIGSAVGRYMGVALGKGDVVAAREYWGTGNLVLIPLLALTGLLYAGLGFFLGAKWYNVKPEHVNLLQMCFLAGSVGLFLSYYSQLWQIVLQVHLNFKFVGLLRTVATLAQVIPQVLIAWRTGNPLLMTLWSAAIAALQLAAMIWYVRRTYSQGFDLRFASLARAREMAAYTAKIFATLMSSGFLATIDRQILGRLASAKAFNPYHICNNVGTRLQGLGVSVMPPVFHNTSFAVGRGGKSSAGAIYSELFDFTFGWYVLASVWAAVWHPALLRLWLGPELGAATSPIFTPLIIGFCLGGLASVSSPQLSALNRAGTALAFSLAMGALAAAGVYLGWQVNGVTGAAWGFLASRLVYVAQDIYTARLVGATGWLNSKLWFGLLAQVAIGGAFALLFLVWPRESFWLLIPAVLHGGLVAAWLLRAPLRRVAGNYFPFLAARTAAAEKIAPGL